MKSILGTYILFVIFFTGFFFFWHPDFKIPYTGLDTEGLYFDSYYRSGWIRPFDFTLVTSNPLMDTYYSPLPTVLFNIFSSFFGRWPAPYYILAFLLHGLNTILVYQLSMNLSRRQSLSFLSSLIFLFHPANIQTLSWLSAVIVYLLTAVFYLSCLIFFVQFLQEKSKGAYAKSLLFFLLACFSKLVAITLIPIMMAIDLILYKNQFRNLKQGIFHQFCVWFSKYIPFLFLAFPFIAIMIYRYPFGGIPHAWGGVSAGLFPLLRLAEFITSLFFPFFLKTERSYLFVFLAFLLWMGLVFKGGSWRLLALWIVFSFSMYTISNFRDVSELYQKHFYIATIPYSILYSSLIVNLFSKARALFSIRYAV